MSAHDATRAARVGRRRVRDGYSGGPAYSLVEVCESCYV